MIFIPALLSSVLSVAFTNAAPPPQGRAGTIASQCTNISVHNGLPWGNWLVGDCLTGNGSTRITSATYLNSKLGNNDGVLVWSIDGTFSQGCGDCQFDTDNGGSNLSCWCNRAWPNTGASYATVNLDEHIGVYSGHLLSDLKGPPTIPSKPSQYPVPSDFSHSVGGAATCVDWPYPEQPDWCQSVNPTCTNSTSTTDTSGASIEHHGPVHTCFVPSVYFTWYPFQFSEIKLVGEGAWG